MSTSKLEVKSSKTGRVLRKQSGGQQQLEAILNQAPRWNPMGIPVGLETEHGVLAADSQGLHFKPVRGRTLYSVSWEQVARMFKLETLASNPDAAIFKTDLLTGHGK